MADATARSFPAPSEAVKVCAPHLPGSRQRRNSWRPEAGAALPRPRLQKVQEVLKQMQPFLQKAANAYNVVEPYLEKGWTLAVVRPCCAIRLRVPEAAAC